MTSLSFDSFSRAGTIVFIIAILDLRAPFKIAFRTRLSYWVEIVIPC